MKRILSIALCIVLCFGIIGAMASCGKTKTNYAKDNTQFVIGVSGPLTGGAAVYGQAVKNAAQMAVDEINAAGGLGGITFKLVAYDDMHKAEKVAVGYSSLYEGGMQVSLGTVTTAPGLEFKNLSYEDNLFFLTPSATGDDIPKKSNGYQMCFADSNQGAKAAEYVNANYAGKTIGVFYKSDDAYSNGIYEKFTANLDSSITVKKAVFTAANESDFSTQIDTLKDLDFIFMPIYYQPAALFMTQAKGIIANDAVYYGCDGFDGIDSYSEAGFSISNISQKIIMLSHFNSKATDGAAKTFIDKYTQRFGGETLNQFGASAYDCVYAIYGAMKAAIDGGTEIPVSISPWELSEILQKQFKTYTLTGGVTGDSISWDATGYVQKTAVQYIIKDAD